MSIRRIVTCTLLLASGPALAQTPDQPPAAQPPAPAQPPAEPAPPATNPTPAAPPAAEKPAEAPADKHADKPMVTTKWDANLYGFVEADSILDSTQGLSDVVGSSSIAHPNTYAANHPQMIFSARNSRIGLKLGAPDYNGIKATAQLEMDFLGNQAGSPDAQYLQTSGKGATILSEQQFWQNPTFRFRHLNLKLETPTVDVLIGQYWQLFGWQSTFHPNSVEIQGLPGQVYSRSPQIRVGKTIKSGDLAVELAIAASRPPQRASATPDGQAGVKVTYNGVKALHTAGSTGTAVDGLSFGLSFVGRRFAVNNFPASDKEVAKDGYGVSIDALIPILPATKDKHGNALTLTGSFTTGAGIADLYQSLTGGVSQPPAPNPMGLPPGQAPVYVANVDNGLVQWFASDNTLHPVQWTTALVGLQYYLPGEGKHWLSANYSHTESNNAKYFGGAGAVWTQEDFADVNLFCDVTPAVRLGLEGAYFDMTYVDTKEATNYRAQFSAFFLF
jgi:hypothetical protein